MHVSWSNDTNHQYHNIVSSQISWYIHALMISTQLCYTKYQIQLVCSNIILVWKYFCNYGDLEYKVRKNICKTDVRNNLKSLQNASLHYEYSVANYMQCCYPNQLKVIFF